MHCPSRFALLLAVGLMLAGATGAPAKSTATNLAQGGYSCVLDGHSSNGTVSLKGVIQLTADGIGGLTSGSLTAIDTNNNVCSYALIEATSSSSVNPDGTGQATLHWTSVAPHNCGVDQEFDWALVTFQEHFNFSATNPPNTTGGTCSHQ